MPVDEVVRPLELDARQSFGFERTDDGDTDGQRKARNESRTLLEAPAKRERQAAAGNGGPHAATAATASRLPLGGQQRAVDIAAARAAQQLARRRIDLIDHLDGDRRMQRNSRRARRENHVLVVGRRKQRSLGIRRRDVEFEIFERRPDGRSIEEIGRREQPVAPSADAFQRETRRFGLFQQLRNAGAREPHRSGEILARVEGAVRKLAQQREAQRSKH